MKTIIKPSFILSIISLFLFSCVNPQKSNQIESKKKDSIFWADFWAEKDAKAFKHADSIFTGFMDLKWNSSKKEAIKYFKASKELKVDFITSEGDVIYLKGSFAGSIVKSLSLTYFNDKLYDVWIDFGYKSDVFQQTLIENLEIKYGKAYKTEKLCKWDFGIHSEENNPIIYFSDDKEGLSLTYISKYRDEYEAEKQRLEDNKEKSSIKLKDL
ncbi:MAG: hypothetical protein Q8S54_11705 [Bacteroidota bacterium]|nr:hypothetical protein [Bacteroidota bacterium]